MENIKKIYKKIWKKVNMTFGTDIPFLEEEPSSLYAFQMLFDIYESAEAFKAGTSLEFEKLESCGTAARVDKYYICFNECNLVNGVVNVEFDEVEEKEFERLTKQFHMSNNYIATTVDIWSRMVADVICEHGNTARLSLMGFENFDFCISDHEVLHGEIEKNRLSEWYGVKKINTGFDSSDLILAADYYGGGCAEFQCISEEECKPCVKGKIQNLIMECLMNNGHTITPDSVLVIELSK